MSTQNGTHQFEIVDGPDKSRILAALSEAYHQQPGPLVVAMTFSGGRTEAVVITALEHESGSGHDWLFKGWVLAQPRWKKVRGYFSTANRKGWLQFLDEETGIVTILDREKKHVPWSWIEVSALMRAGAAVCCNKMHALQLILRGSWTRERIVETLGHEDVTTKELKKSDLPFEPVFR